MAGSTNWPSSLDSHTGGNPFGFAEVGNLIYTRLTAAATAAATTLTVASTTGFASRGIVIVGLETITYTGTTSTTFTGCTRAAGGTTAAAYGIGAIVGSAPVAANLNDHSAAIVAIETVLGAGITSSLGVMRKIAEVNGTGASGVLEFSSIPATYRELQITLIGRSDTAGSAGTGVRLTFETSPTAGAYNLVAIQASTGAASAPEQFGASDFLTITNVPTAGCPANLAGAAKAFLLEYANTSFYKSVHVLGNQLIDLVSGSATLRNSHGVWESTAAIARVRLTLSSGNWTTTSRATLWGVPA